MLCYFQVYSKVIQLYIVCAQLLSHVLLFVAPWTVACQAPLSMGFSSQEYWSGLSLPLPGDLPHPGTEPTSFASPALAGAFFITVPPWKPHMCVCVYICIYSF